ncbi:MAG: UvrD-helicase domain-containing protein [Deltaproteobacteria bacterium]|nr:UvrD-helicase domain-containing protein [Deltaproteobacteria bacterium]
MKEFTHEQIEIIESSGGCAVLAGAGTGKTTTLVSKCIALLNKNPNAKILAVSFTEKSAKDLEEKLIFNLLQNSASSRDEHWIMTIHGFCGAILKEYPMSVGLNGTEQILSAFESKALWDESFRSLFWDLNLPAIVERALDFFMELESTESLFGLLTRVRELQCFGVFEFFNTTNNPANKHLDVLAKYCISRYQKTKNRMGVLDFYDLEIKAHDVLKDEKIRKSYQSRFDFILVDEFQDTNPTQAELIWKIAKPWLSNLCVVGDPKQSIYRFRDADVSVFEEYCQKLPLQLTLSNNFRSQSEILELINSSCQKAFHAQGLKYDPLCATVHTEEKNACVKKLVVQSPKELALWLKVQVSHGAKLDDMALLLRKIRGSNAKWLRGLHQEGIPLAIGSGGLFWEDPRVRELVSFLRWWDIPFNSLSGAVFLRAPWVGISDEILDKWVREDKSFQKPFFESDHPLAIYLNQYRNQSIRPGELLLALLNFSSPNEFGIEEAMAASIFGLWHRVEELSLRGKDFHEIIEELTCLLKTHERELEVPPPKTEGQLQVLTIHGAKGLEFKQVILVDFAAKPQKAAPAPLLYWDRKRGVYLAKRDMHGDRLQSDEEEMIWKDAEREKSLAESMRLFYVALTRAKEKLVLVFPKDDETITSEKSTLDVYARDYWKGWIEEAQFNWDGKTEFQSVQSEENTQVSFSLPKVDFKISVTKPAFKRTRHSVTEWNLLSRCQRAYEWTYIRPGLEAENLDKKVNDFKKRILDEAISSTKLGTRVHEILEKGDYDSFYEIEKQVGSKFFNAKMLIEWAQNSPWMRPTTDKRRVWTELSFEVPIYPACDDVLVGSIDRLILQNDGFTIIDFKVLRRLRSQQELILEYGTQLSLYREALEVLEPSAREKTKAYIIQIFPQGVEEVLMPASESALSTALSKIANEIINGKSGSKIGSHCDYCELKSKCLIIDK